MSSSDNESVWNAGEESWKSNDWESGFVDEDQAENNEKITEEVKLDAVIEMMTSETKFIQADERVQSLRSDSRLTEQQIAAIAGDDLNILKDEEQPSPPPDDSSAGVASNFESLSAPTRLKDPSKVSEKKITEKELEKFQEATNLFNVGARDAKLGKVDSHELVELDENGEPFFERFAFVDEHSCIGCTMCAGIAQATFMMEDGHGRARVYQQHGDADSVIEEAIDTCPVNCIHYVPWEELVSLEARRRNQVLDFFTLLRRTEQGTGDPGKAGKDNGPLEISGNSGSRCNNCPGNGCKNCPMFSVGENPKYLMRELKKKQKREARAAATAESEGTGAKKRADL